MNYYQALAQTYHKDFLSCLSELTETSSPFWRREIIKDLHKIQADAQELLDLDVLHPLDAGRLKHILGRDLKEFIYLTRHKEKLPDAIDNSALLKRHGIPTRNPA